MKITRALACLVLGSAGAAFATSGCSAGEPSRNDEPIMAVQQRGVSECPQPDNQTEYCPADTLCAYGWFCEPCCCPGCTQCQSVKAPQGTSCDDGNACTVNESCNGYGTCMPGTPKNCDDSNPCTVDSCNASAGGCVHTPEPSTKSCNDGNACTTGDHCSGTGSGSCVAGAALSCDDGKVCTSDSCSPSSGCVYTPLVGAACDDGNPCTVGTSCTTSLTCAGGSPLNCNDGNPCTTDACGAGGCAYSNNTNACSDGNICTQSDACSGGTCKGGAPIACNDNNPCTNDSCNAVTGCVYTSKPNGDTCDDGNSCSTGDQCTSGVCAGTGGLNCNDSNPCTKNTCSGGVCQYPSETDGTSCNDNNKCTLTDSCKLGTCQGNGVPNCDDNNPCTTDSCDPTVGCKHVNSAGSCNDGDLCTENDTCSNGTCQTGTPMKCVASDECHKAGACASATGKCDAETVQPDDTACTGGKCKAGTCVLTSDGGTDAGADAGDAAVGGSGGSGGSGATSTGGAAGSTGGGAGTGAGGSGTGGSAGSAGSGTGGKDGVYVPDEAGCKCRVPSGRDSTPGGWALAGLAALALAARRRRVS